MNDYTKVRKAQREITNLVIEAGKKGDKTTIIALEKINKILGE